MRETRLLAFFAPSQVASLAVSYSFFVWLLCFPKCIAKASCFKWAGAGNRLICGCVLAAAVSQQAVGG